jgi:hypothetical protein
MNGREFPSPDEQNLELPISGCYHEGESVLNWLNQLTEDTKMQDKKSEILHKIATGHWDSQTRMDIGDHTNTPVEALLMLTADANVDVRFALAENHNLHESILKALLEDSNPYVAHRARMTLRTLTGHTDPA